MNDLYTFQAFCTLLMCDDPTNLQPEDRTRLENWANREAVEFGFHNWVEAYNFITDKSVNSFYRSN